MPSWKPSLVAVIDSIIAAVIIAGAIAVFKWVRGHNVLLRNRTRHAKGDRLAIFVARLGNDQDSETARNNVMRSIQEELGEDCIEILPASVRLKPDRRGGFNETTQAAVRGVKFLRKKNGDLLIWGQTRIQNGRAVVDIFFLSAAHSTGAARRFEWTTRLTLGEPFGREMRSALAAVAAAAAGPTTEDTGHYLTAVLRPAGEKLKHTIENIPPAMSVEDRGLLYISFGLIQSALGYEGGDREQLRTAVAAYREALKEYARERMPLQWATTQNNLGNALGRLGERESGTARLEEAVAAHREALKEYTRGRAPLDWAMTQNNLGNALLRLGSGKAAPRGWRKRCGTAPPPVGSS